MTKVGRCYETHPALPVGEFKIYGGNCGHPIHLDCDVYVALQAGSYVTLPQPWESGYGDIVQVHFTIPDMGTPRSSSEFKSLIDWLCNQLQAGKKVHVGCIGGHGRTGMVLAAVVAKMAMPSDSNAIGYVRKHYCEKAVESREQVAYLVKHYGVKSVSGAKEGQFDVPQFKGTSWSPKQGSGSYKQSSGAKELPSGKKESKFGNSLKEITPVPSPRNIYAKAA